MTGTEETRRIAVVDAFTDVPLSGNAAGVVPDAGGLSDDQMQAVARELGASETAFLLVSDRADRRVRFFSPTTEVDLCGHATIASHALLFEDGVVGVGEHSLETPVGTIEMAVEADGTVWMTGEQPTVRALDLDPEHVGRALGVDPVALRVEGLPIAFASTGLPVLVVPVDYFEALGAADPDEDAVSALCDEAGVEGVYAFTFDTLSAEATLHGRMFAPPLGIREDPVTGTASGAAGAYLRFAEAFEAMPDEMVFEQGHFVDRPGSVRVRVDAEVRVGGRAAVSIDGTLTVPEPDDDEIIEA